MTVENLANRPKNIIRQLQQQTANESLLREILLSLTPEHLDENTINLWLTALLETAPQIPDLPEGLMDCCGTGGSGLPHFNTSTITAFILAANGIPVVKFGNRGIQQPHGSFDFLSALGFDKPIAIQKLPVLLDKSGLSFLFAPQCYPYLAPLHQVRKTLTSPTLFHYIGPLLNPVLPQYRLMGLSNKSLFSVISNCLASHPILSKRLKQAFLVHNSIDDTPIGLDELAPLGTSQISRITPNGCTPYSLEKTQTSSKEKSHIETLLKDISVSESVAIFQDLLNGNCPDTQTVDWAKPDGSPKQRQAFCQELVLQNAALGLIAANKATSFEEARQQVTAIIKSGKLSETFKKHQEAYDACHD